MQAPVRPCLGGRLSWTCTEADPHSGPGSWADCGARCRLSALQLLQQPQPALWPGSCNFTSQVVGSSRTPGGRTWALIPAPTHVDGLLIGAAARLGRGPRPGQADQPRQLVALVPDLCAPTEWAGRLQGGLDAEPGGQASTQLRRPDPACQAALAQPACRLLLCPTAP